MKVAVSTAIRFLAVALVYFICFSVVSGALLSNPQNQPSPAEAATALAALLAVSVINAAVWTWVVIRSRWSGWKLILTIFLVFYGVGTFMPQIETAYFVTNLPPGMVTRLFIAGLIIAAVFSPLAVLILGKARGGTKRAGAGTSALTMPVSAWAIKLSLIAIVYVVIYFTFGYFIAWKSPAVRAYYGGTDPGNFIGQMRNVLRTDPLLLLLQFARGLLWAAIAVPVIRMMKGEWWETGLAVAVLFAMTSSLLLLPNPLMPSEVRMAHLLETSTSNFLFGWLVVLILRYWTFPRPATSQTVSTRSPLTP